jgi:spermidine synthase
MAIIWQETRDGTHYQVRTAGKTIRLYTDTVLHSQYNPAKKLTGSVWDLLFLPALCLTQTKPLRVLVLGVGGGAIMHMMSDFFNCEKIIGLELNPTHIEIAQHYFALNSNDFELIETDAIEWVENYNGEKFDVIIDDLFYEEEGEPVKVATPDATWFYHLYSQLKPKGIVIMNFVGRHSAMSASPLHDDNVQNLLPYGLHLTTPFYDNHVLAFSSHPLHSRVIRKTINQHEKLKALKQNLRFACRNFSR